MSKPKHLKSVVSGVQSNNNNNNIDYVLRNDEKLQRLISDVKIFFEIILFTYNTLRTVYLTSE